MKDLSSIVAKFNTQGTITEIKPLGTGLINDTYKVNTQEADAPDYVLQRINHAIFQNVEMLQSNIAAVTGHIRKKLTLSLIHILFFYLHDFRDSFIYIDGECQIICRTS